MALNSCRRSGSNENVSTYGLGGLGRDYTSLATWESATDNNLVANEVSEVLFVCYDAASYADEVIISGATTDADYFRIIRGSYREGSTGIPSEMVTFTKGTIGAVISIVENFFVVTDIFANNTATSGAGAAYGINVTTSTDCIIAGCAAKAVRAGNGYGYYLPSGSTRVAVIDCLAFDCTVSCLTEAGCTEYYVYNCTFVDSGNGVTTNATGTRCRLKNTLVYNCTTAFAGDSYHGDSTNNATDASTVKGASSYANQTFTFIDEVNDDFHLGETDVGARSLGAPLDADDKFAFNDDVDWEEIQVWSIGFDCDGAFASPDPDCDCPGSFTEVGTANGALTYLGVGVITAFNEGSKQAALLQAIFAPTRRRLQQQYRWEFCLRRKSYVAADAVSGVPTWGFNYGFLLPNTALQLWEVGDPHTSLRYRLENKHILVDQDTLDIIYSIEVTDPDQWSPSFQEALELKLASKMAMTLIRKPEIMRMYEDMFQDKIAEAAFMNDIQSDDYESYSAILWGARAGFSTRDIPLDLG